MKSTPKILAAFFSAALLIGCATADYNAGTRAAEAGNYAVAERHLLAAIRQGETAAWNNLGVVYDRTRRTDMANRAFNMGARHGHPVAQQNLIARGLPVPAADLASSGSSDGAAIAAMLQGFNAGRNQPSKSVICDTKKNGQSATTICF